MVFCKNAEEYWHELWKLRGAGYREYRQKKVALNAAFDKIDDPSTHDYEKLAKAIHDLLWDCLKESRDFENRQPEKPLFIFHKNRKFYEIKFITEQPGLWISPKPISPKERKVKSEAWILQIYFNGNAVDIVRCQNCNEVFTRDRPHQKYCIVCQLSPRLKRSVSFIDGDNRRSCLMCGKNIPVGKNKRTKYCCGACRTAAFKKRKNDLIN